MFLDLVMCTIDSENVVIKTCITHYIVAEIINKRRKDLRCVKTSQSRRLKTPRDSDKFVNVSVIIFPLKNSQNLEHK